MAYKPLPASCPATQGLNADGGLSSKQKEIL